MAYVWQAPCLNVRWGGSGMQAFYTGAFLRHPVGGWRVFCGSKSRELGPVVPVFTHRWARAA